MTAPARRLDLYEHARDSWGVEAASTLMDMLPPEPADLATKADLAVTTAELRAEMAELRTEMAELRTDLRTEMAELRVEFKAEIATLTRTYVLSSVGTVLTIVAAVGLFR